MTTTLVTYVNIDLYDKNNVFYSLQITLKSISKSKSLTINFILISKNIELDVDSNNSNPERTRHDNFLTHQFQINHRLCILRHAYLHKTSNYETILNNNKVLINLLSFVNIL